jgi:Peptidase family M23
MNERNQIALKLILLQIVLPIFLICAFFFISKDAYLSFVIIELYLGIIFLAGYWEFFSHLFKIIFFILIELLLLFILFNKIMTSANLGLDMNVIIIFTILGLYLLYNLVKIILTILKKEKNAFEIFFPYRNGKYLITDGGDSKTSRLMNYHYHSLMHRRNKTNHSMLFATDIIKTSPNKKRFLPVQNEEYPIFNENVYCPMEGKVIKVVNDIDDNIPFSGNYPYNTGNTVIIKNANYFFLLGHLKKESIVVSEGRTLEKGALIGQTGNSGYSERPHLHMQLTESQLENFWVGKGISILYKGRNLYKNRVIKID